jgi:hypothetical protein
MQTETLTALLAVNKQHVYVQKHFLLGTKYPPFPTIGWKIPHLPRACSSPPPGVTSSAKTRLLPSCTCRVEQSQILPPIFFLSYININTFILLLLLSTHHPPFSHTHPLHLFSSFN